MNPDIEDGQSLTIAMPYLTDNENAHFAKVLGNEITNRKLAKSLLKKNPQEIFDLGDGVKVYRVGTNKGYIFMYNPKEDLIGYYVQLEEQKRSLLGKKVTQTAVWRSMEDEKADGLTYKVVFDYLLKKYPAIMSDKIQTQDGKNFWIRLMFRALNRGNKIVLADLNLRSVEEIDMRADLRLITTNPPKDNPWGQMLKHKAMRFAIFAKE